MLNLCTHCTLNQLYVDLMIAYKNGIKCGTLQGTAVDLPQHRIDTVNTGTLMMGLYMDNGGCGFGDVWEEMQCEAKSQLEVCPRPRAPAMIRVARVCN